MTSAAHAVTDAPVSGKIMTDAPELSVLMPCLNEAQTLAGCIDSAFQAIRKLGLSAEVLVADNGSTDGSQEIAKRSGARVVHAHQKGYGYALQAGIAASRGKYILMGDADGSYDFGAVAAFLGRLREGSDLVMGCRAPRYGGRIEKGAMPWKHRWIGNPALSGLGRLLFSSPVHDFHCGLRAFRRKAILALNLRTGGMEFASEMVIKATLAGLKIAQVPVTLRPDGRLRPPHLRSWRDGWRHLRFMLLYSPDWLFIYPGLILALLGLVGYALAWTKTMTTPSLQLDLNALIVFSILLIAGFQIFTFGIFAKAYSVSKGLLPGKDRWKTLIKGHSAEVGTIIGIIMIAGGVIAGHAALNWKEAGFGPLSSADGYRLVIPAVTAIGIGLQAVFYGFALNILGLE